MQSESQILSEEAELDPVAMDAIRSLLADSDAEEDVPVVAPARPSAARELGVAPMAAAPVAPAASLPPRKADGLPDLAAVPPEVPGAEAPQAKPARKARAPRQASALRQRMQGHLDAGKARVLGYRPTRRHIFWGGFALLVLLRPWLVVGLMFLLAFVVVGIFLILGYDGFWRRGMAIGRWYARRNPERSVEMHRKLDQFAVRFDAFLDRFPEGTVDGLYLPDFGDVAEAEARHAEAMERRLASMQQSKA